MTADSIPIRTGRRARVLVGRSRNVARRAVQSAGRRLDPVRDLYDPERSRCLPADLDDLLGYQERFLDTARLFELFVRRTRQIEPGPGRSIAVVVQPWWATPSPWYAIALGLGLARRGRHVTFVWHDLPFPQASRSMTQQIDEIGRALHVLGQRFPVIRLSELPAEPLVAAVDDALLDRLADENLMWLLRGGEPSPGDLVLRGQMRASLLTALPKVRALFRSGDYDSAVLCGGVVGASGLYLQSGQAADVRVATFDAGLGATAIDIDGVAAQHPDAVRAFATLTAAPVDERAAAIAAGREEYASRRAGLDADQYQAARPGGTGTDGGGSGSEGGRSGVLIPLSVIFDAAALGRHHLFADSREWLVETVAALLRDTGDEVIVRQHPSERKREERSRVDVSSTLRESFGTHPQVRFIAAEADVSTYDLLEECRLVVPFVSTIGIEAAALGLPVVLSGDAYYADLGFVWAPKTRDEYFRVLGQGARGELPLLPDQVARAWQSYYLTAVCQRVRTDFTPQPPDFWRWALRRPEELYEDPGVQDILRSLDEGVPLSVLRHRRRTASSLSA